MKVEISQFTFFSALGQSSMIQQSAGPMFFRLCGVGTFLLTLNCSVFRGAAGASLPPGIAQSSCLSIIRLLGLDLCVGECFSCFLTLNLFGGVEISLSRWSLSQDISQSICEPATTEEFFSRQFKKVPQFVPHCQVFL